MTNRDQRRPNCPVCGTYTAARNRRRRQNCEPFCTMRCAAQYGRSEFDPRTSYGSGDPYPVWDVQSRNWVTGTAPSYIHIQENGWQRREPKRWHSEEDY